MYTNHLYPDPVSAVANMLGLPVFLIGVAIAVLAFWSIVWKGYGLWYAARDKKPWWFVAFLLINDLGILEIIYLLWVRKSGKAASSLTGQTAAPAAAEPSGAGEVK